MNLYRNGLLRWPPFHLSLLLAALGGGVLGAKGGAVDLRWTEAIYVWLQTQPNESWLAFFDWLSRDGGGQLPTILLIAGSVFYWLYSLWKGRRIPLGPTATRWRRNTQLVVLAALLIGLCSPLLKGKFARERPRYHNENVDYTPWYDFHTRNRENPFKRGSFPSGHTLQATLILAVVHWLGHGLPLAIKGIALKPVFVAVGASYVALMGFSRIVLAKHWLGDVFFSVIIGFWLISFSAWIVYRNAQSCRHESLS